jgi:hypothetical protein
MPTTLVTIRNDVLNRLDDPNNNFWSTSELNTWINEGARDIARRAESLVSFSSTIAIVAGTQTYSAPTNTVQIHRLEYIPTGSTQTYPIFPSTYEEMDQLWGIYQSIQSAYPSYFVTRGWANGIGSDALTIVLYPVPSQAGTLNVFYYRLPTAAVADGDTVEIPEGWQDLVALYCESVARRKAKDPTWQEARQMYEDELKNLIDVTRFYHDSSSAIITRTGAVPAWLYEFD